MKALLFCAALCSCAPASKYPSRAACFDAATAAASVALAKACSVPLEDCEHLDLVVAGLDAALVACQEIPQ
jgi:hypothetical protein